MEFRLALLAIQLRAYVSKREGARLTMKDRPSRGMGEPRAGESFVKLEIEVPIQNRVRGYLDSGGREDSVPFHPIYPYTLEFPFVIGEA